MISQSRRGVVLPLVAIFIVVAAFLAALVVDFSRAYAQKNELQTMADAAAHAGVIELYEDADNVATAGYLTGAENEVLMRVLPVGNADFECGVWDDSSGAFTPAGTSCSSADNAVRATVRDTVNWIFPLLAGVAPKQITATATAWMGYVRSAKCVKPWGLNWQTLTRALDPGWPEVRQCQANPDDPNYGNCEVYLQKDPDRPALDAGDLARLENDPPEALRFELTEREPPGDPGNFGALRLAAPGRNEYVNSIAECFPEPIGAGDTLDTQPGGMGVATGQAVRELCENEGYLVGDECQDSDGQAGLPVIAVLWVAPPPVGSSEIVVRQLVTFKIERISGNPNAVVTGHFRPLTTPGGVTTDPTTLRRPILVQ
jgi:Flp pilus assembly protein TadG